MKPATRPSSNPHSAKLLVVDGCGRIRHAVRGALAGYLKRGDLVVANDAATLPASLSGIHATSGEAIEVRLAGRSSLDPADFTGLLAVVFGRGDYRIRTEDRLLPPAFSEGDQLALGPLRATVAGIAGHPRLLRLSFEGSAEHVWAGIARHGRPVQYAHVPEPLALWDVWTRYAARAVAFEPPSAGLALDWRLMSELSRRGVRFETLTHAAGLSSTGDPELDSRLPFDEPYHLPERTVRAVAETRREGGRIVAVGTTVVRALEHAASRAGGLRPGDGIATQRIGPATPIRVVDVLLTGTHSPGESHYELLGALVAPELLVDLSDALEAEEYRTHEFGDSILLARAGA